MSPKVATVVGLKKKQSRSSDAVGEPIWLWVKNTGYLKKPKVGKFGKIDPAARYLWSEPRLGGVGILLTHLPFVCFLLVTMVAWWQEGASGLFLGTLRLCMPHWECRKMRLSCSEGTLCRNWLLWSGKQKALRVFFVARHQSIIAVGQDVMTFMTFIATDCLESKLKCLSCYLIAKMHQSIAT